MSIYQFPRERSQSSKKYDVDVDWGRPTIEGAEKAGVRRRPRSIGPLH